jgi:hypothetical protein
MASAIIGAMSITLSLEHFFTFSDMGIEFVTTNSFNTDSSMRFKAFPRMFEGASEHKRVVKKAARRTRENTVGDDGIDCSGSLVLQGVGGHS